MKTPKADQLRKLREMQFMRPKPLNEARKKPPPKPQPNKSGKR